MPETPVIRVFEAADSAAVIALWKLVLPSDAAWNEPGEVIERKMQVQPELFFVATSEGGIVGTVIAGFDGVRGWIHKLAVHPNWRRRGLASNLMQSAEQGLRDMGCLKLNLQVRPSNLDVLKFYQALGYEVEDRASLGKPL